MSATEIWTIKATLDWLVGYLERKGDESPLLSAQWLISEVTGLSRIELYMNHDKPLSMEEREVLRGYATRRGRGEPLQYITGEVGFRHITLKVRPGVLIPRPETEVLVSEVLAALPQPEKRRSAEFLAEMEAFAAPAESVGDERAEREGDDALAVAADVLEGDAMAASGESADLDECLLIADICTGSGCIACSLAYEHPLARVIATDIAPEAIALAQENVQLLDLADRVHVLQSDLGAAIPSRYLGRFDAVVSNPPYVPTAVMADIPREVADYEPALALDGGTDGLDLYRPLLAWAHEALKPGGLFAAELHETCLDEAADVARMAGWSNVRIVYDLANRPRILTAQK